MNPTAVQEHAPAKASDRFEGLVLEFLAYLELERGLSRNTLNAYRTDLLQYGSFLAERQADALCVGSGDISEFLAELATGNGTAPCSAATIHRKAACLRSFYKHLRREEMIDEDPTAALSPPRRARKLPHVLNYAEVQKLLAAPRGDEPTTLRDRALLEVMYACGLRASETIGLDVADVDLHEGFLRARGKGSKERIVPLGRQAIAAISGYLRGGRAKLVGDRHEAKLFLNFRGGPLTRQGLYKIVQRSRIEPAHPSPQLRHSPARRRLRPPRRPGDARPRRHRDDPDVHASLRRAAEGRLLPRPPARQRLTHTPRLTHAPGVIVISPGRRDK
jgi:integrase/recombinase XerD